MRVFLLRKEGRAPHFEREIATAGRSGLPFFGGFEKEMPKLVLALAFHLSDSQTGTGDGCMFLLEPRASDYKHMKKQRERRCVGS